MIHLLLVLALILVVVYFVFGSVGAAMNLIWLAVIVLAVLWLLGFMRGRRRTY